MRFIITLFMALSFSTSLLAAEKSKVSLRDKIGQMLIIGFDGKKINAHSPVVQLIEKNNIGGVILYDYDFKSQKFDKNIESPAQVKQLNKDLQYFSQSGNEKYHRPLLPLLISVDYEGGETVRLDEKYGFPSTMSAADLGNKSLDEAGLLAESMALTLKKAGFNLNFAPVLDVNVNSDNPIIGKKGRSFSSDASKVASYAGVFSSHYLKHNIQCAYKHFPGHGSSTNDSHLGFVDVTATWQPYELAPYQRAFTNKEACGMVMTAHIVNRQLDASGKPATLSSKILTELLRNQLHFKGVIITDDMQMKAISDNFSLEQALVLAINAGADMLTFGGNLFAPSPDPAQLIDIIEAKVSSGEISQQRIEEAYQRIVAFKQSLKGM